MLVLKLTNWPSAVRSLSKRLWLEKTQQGYKTAAGFYSGFLCTASFCLCVSLHKSLIFNYWTIRNDVKSYPLWSGPSSICLCSASLLMFSRVEKLWFFFIYTYVMLVSLYSSRLRGVTDCMSVCGSHSAVFIYI